MEKRKTTPATPVEKIINSDPAKLTEDEKKVAQYVDNQDLQSLPEKVTEEMLRDYRKKVTDLEDGRPGYDPEDMDLLTNNITWAYNLLSAYQEFDILLSAKIRDNRTEGIPSEDLGKELGEVRKQVRDLLIINNNIWEDFRALYEKTKKEAEKSKEIVSVNSKPIDNFLEPLDKLNAVAWNRGDIKGKQEFEVKVEKAGSQKQVSIPFSLNLTEIQEKCPELKRLDSIDKRVWTISDALYRSGQDIVSYNQMYKYIGHGNNKGGQSKEDIINQAYTKLNAEIFFDNQEEVNAGYHYKHFKYTGPILANERLEADDQVIIINGNKVDSAIHILNKSRLLDFAIDRRDDGKHGQVARLPIEVYQTPLQLTEQNAELEDYILTWLLRALDSNKASDHSRKMDTLYRRFKMTGKTATDRKRRERLKEKIVTLLDYYKSLDLTIDGKQLDKYEMTDSLKLKFKKVDQ